MMHASHAFCHHIKSEYTNFTITHSNFSCHNIMSYKIMLHMKNKKKENC